MTAEQGTPTPADLLGMELAVLSMLPQSMVSPAGRADYWVAKAELYRAKGDAAHADKCEAYAAQVRDTGRMDLPGPDDPDAQPSTAPIDRGAYDADLTAALDLLGDGLDNEAHAAEVRRAGEQGMADQ